MGTQRERLRALGIELGDKLGPQEASGAELGDLHEEVHADCPEEGQARCELVDVHTGVEAGADVLDAVGEGVRQFQIGRRSGFLDVVARDGDGVVLRHFRAGVREDVRDDPHRGLRRIDVGVTNHELFEDVVLDRSGQLVRSDTLLACRSDVQRENRQHGAVHRHRDRDLREVDSVEELTHVEDGIDCDTGHSDVTGNARMIGVVAAVCGEVEGDREALLTGREVTTVERIRLRGSGESGVLANGPRLVHVHGRVRTTQERRCAREAVERVTRLGGGRAVRTGVHRLDVDAFRGGPDNLLGGVVVGVGALFDERLGLLDRRRCGCRRLRVLEWDLGETADHVLDLSCRHLELPVSMKSSSSVRADTASMRAVRNPSGRESPVASATAFSGPASSTLAMPAARVRRTAAAALSP